jgi:hypothetical protein
MNYLRRYAQQNAFAPGLVQNANSPLQQALGGAKPRAPSMGMPIMSSNKPMQTVDWRPPGWRQPARPQRQPRYGGMGGVTSNTPGIRWKAY